MGGGDLLKAGRLGALALAVCLPACDGGGGSIRRGDGGAVVVDGGQGETGPDAGEGGEGGQGGQGGGGADQGVAVDACVPRDCLPTDCGPRPDGCGGIIQCDAGCACQGEGCPCEAPEQCTPQPCRAPRCDAGVCAYDPVTCGAEACECKVEPCDDAAPRRCGAGCEAQFCDPSPDGRGDYLNRCVPIAELPCGACGIATSACDAETGAVTCDDLIAVEDAQGRRCEQLVLFVDGAYRGEQRGTRLAPFHDLAAALDLAALADVRFVIIGGSGNVLGPVVLRDGIELRGGYSGHPFFQPSDDRPTVRVEVTEQALAAGQLVALTALGVATGGAVRGLDLAVPDAPASPAGPSDDGQAGVHTVGLLAIGSPALVVEDVAITVGSASDGVPGADAAPVEAELDPVLMDGQPGLNVHARSPGDCEEDRDRVCDRYPNRCAQPCSTNDPIGPVFPGADGAPGAVCPADVDGIRAQTNPGGRGGQRATICEGNAPGERPAWPEREVNRRAGAPGAPGGALDGLQRWRTHATGQPGLPGIGGRPGAGGASEAAPSCPYGAGGGGGGAGGCGGFGGRPGGGGGSALGVLAIDSTGLTLTGVTATVGDGGAGAPGGLGSEGLPGGTGGVAGLADRGQASNAQPGQDGGVGHPGGPGGNGAGGDAIGVLCVDTALADLPAGFADGITIGGAGSGAAAHADANAQAAPAGRAQPVLGCAP